MNRQNLSALRIAYPNQSLDSVLSAPINQQLVIHSVIACNGSAASNDIAISHSLPDAHVVIETQALDITLDIQAGVASDIIGTSNGDYFTVQSKEKFGLIVLNITQAETGSPVHAYQYWDGSSFVALTLQQTPDFSTVGRKSILFAPPIDWALDGSDFYTVKVVATTAPTLALMADSLKPCNVLAYREGVLPSAELQVDFETRQLLLQQGEKIIPFFAFPSTSNTVEASYQINP